MSAPTDEQLGASLRWSMGALNNPWDDGLLVFRDMSDPEWFMFYRVIRTYSDDTLRVALQIASEVISRQHAEIHWLRRQLSERAA